jgi:hypothetical protein
MDVPLYQPGPTKIVRITLTDAGWTRLAQLSIEEDLTLEQYLNKVAREAAETR